MTTCIPRAQGVPGVYWQQPPYWLPGGPFPQYTELDDPRWRGAASQGFPLRSDTGEPISGTSEEVSFRALHHTDGTGAQSLYLSWHVRFDPSLDEGNDRLFVGFHPGTGSDALVFEIFPYNSARADITNQPLENLGDMEKGVGSIQTHRLVGGDWEPEADPAWVNLNTRVWLDRVWSSGGVFDHAAWAVQMRVPIKTTASSITDPGGLNLGATFRMWYVCWTVTPGGPTPYEWLSATAPSTIPGEIVEGNFPGPGNWDQFHMSSGPSDPVCPTTGGIALKPTDIGTLNSPSSKIEFSTTDPRPVNTFFARPRNYTSQTIPAPVGPADEPIAARFRVANWGSVADPNVVWEDIPGGGRVRNTDSIPPIPTTGDPPPATNPIRFDWALTNADISRLITGKTPHKCMLVELFGPGLTFFNNSAYRNMDFVEASRFDRDAEINILGLSPMPGGGLGRDVYLAIETFNMPSRLNLRYLLRYVHLMGKRADLLAGDQPNPKAERRNLKELIAMAKAGRLAEDEIEQFMPTYRVHVYHDTGETVELDGATYPVLRSQSSFGYYVEHEGDPFKWLHSLQGAEPISDEFPHFYKVAVPDSGVAKVTTRVVALDPKGLQWLIWLILVIVAFFIRLLRRLLGS